MFPGMNPRAMEQAMRKMGIVQVDIPATEVLIRTKDKDYIFVNPQVAKVNMMGQDTYQVVGKAVERARIQEIEISQDDINTVVEQANTDAETAKKTLKETKGDIAAAILKLQN
ncbi:nascent polypeptide-associated complex protein [Candidatus Woesearchaeota archaeon]|nr:nascent polypeptide-associated complex protein [Candidatus Woesearchaeota archaeon]